MNKLLLFLSLCFVSISYAQNVEFLPENFPNKTARFTEAKSALDDGDIFYDNGQTYCKYQLEPEWFCRKGFGFYDEALLYYRKANAFNPDNALLNFKMGICYLANIKTDSALVHFEKAFSLNPKVHEQQLYLLGRCYQYTGQWENAIEMYSQYLSESVAGRYSDKKLLIAKSEIEDRIAECSRALSAIEVDTTLVVQNLGSLVNSQHSEYGPVISATGYTMLVTGRRPDYRMKPEDLDSIAFETDEDNYMENIYITYNKDDKWMPTKRLGDIITIVGEHSAVLDLSHDSEMLLMYKSQRGGDIFAGNFTDGNWNGMNSLEGEVNSGQFEPSASFNADNTLLYFSSTRSGGVGGKDLYVSKVDSLGVWGKPENLGKTLNTKADEDAVSISVDGKTLYFSSTGHGGLGEYDIFKSELTDSGWSKPVNLGVPINSAYNDIFYCETEDATHRYFSSDRHGGFGKMDIYEIVLPTEMKDSIAENTEESAKAFTGIEKIFPIKGDVKLEGKAIDYKTRKPLACIVSLRDAETGKLVYQEEIQNGEFDLFIESNKLFNLQVEAEGHLAYEETVFGLTGTKVYKATAQLVAEPTLELSTSPLQDGKDGKVLVSGDVINFSSKGTVEADVTVLDSEGKKVKQFKRVKKFEMWMDETKKYTVVTEADGYVTQKSNINFIDSKKEHPMSINMFGPGSADMPFGLNQKKDSLEQLVAFWGQIKEFNSGEYVSANIHVYDVDTEQKVMSSRSTKEGLYKLVLPTNKYYRIDVEADGYLKQSGFVNATSSSDFVFINTQILKSEDAVLKNNVGELLIARSLHKGVLVRGKVKDFNSGNAVRASISIKVAKTGDTFSKVYANEDGEFSFSIPQGFDAIIELSADGYSKLEKPLTVPPAGKLFTMEAELMPEGITAYSVVLPHIHFATAEFDLAKDYALALKGMVRLMELKPNIVMELTGHADSKGEEEPNMKLSRKRVEAVVDYLVKQGVSKKRLSYKGKGESDPIADNETEEGRKLNRRVEVRAYSK